MPHDRTENRFPLFLIMLCGLWAGRCKGAPSIIGFAGYRFFKEPPELQLNYGLYGASWGQGLATDATRAVMRYGFDVLKFFEIIASADAANTASIAVMGRLGMRFDRRVVEEGIDTIYYRLPRAARIGRA